ncbi:MAG: PAS domain S-box protein, partial [Desulfomonile tiedjei]|nr:PAS domain S-box protein [Desulfomonile tiedjei]
RFRLFYENAPLGYQSLDMNGCLLEVNRAWLETLGYTHEEVVGRWFGDFLAPDNVERFRANFPKFKAAGEVCGVQFEMLRKDGSTVTVAFDGQIGRDRWGLFKQTHCIMHDITERKHVEQQLLAQRDALSVIFESAPYILLLVNRDHRIENINRIGAEFAGKPKEKLLGLLGGQVFNCINSFEAPGCGGNVQCNDCPVRTRVTRTFLTGEASYDEEGHLTVISEDLGEVRVDLLISATPVEIDTRDMVLVTMVDITERKKAENELRKSEMRFKNLADLLPQFVYEVNAEGFFTFANQAAMEMSGYTREHIDRGLRLVDVIAPEAAEKAMQGFAKILQGEKIIGQEYLLKALDGKIIPVVSYANPIEQEGKVVGSRGVAVDLTELKGAQEALRHSEATLRTLIEAAPIGIGQVSANRELKWTNEMLCKMTGYSSDELIGQSARILYESDEEYSRVGQVKHPLVRQSGRGSVETRFRRKDGTAIEVLLSSSSIASRDLSHGLVFTAMDITERKVLADQLLHSQKMEAVGVLAGGIAHDFNNLLQVIGGYASVALIDVKEGASGYSEFVEIRKAARRAGELTQALLTFSRRVESKLRPVNLNHEIRNVAKMLSRTIPKMIEIIMNLEEPLDSVNADPAQLQQVVMNLALNARDAMPNGGKLVIETRKVRLDEEYCRSHLKTRPGNYLLLSVSDSGTGMDDETRNHIFDPFFTTKETGKGTGLGLSIVFGIVKSHGGNIICYSESGQGTTFKIYLPALVATADPEETEFFERLRGGNETILLVDDEDSVRKLGAQILKKFGYSVLTATNGKEGLVVYRENRSHIDLVILDLIMPEMGGKDCLAQIL